ncbi:hypothetical protein [Bosea sp. 124]|uniref:hypothetical protein n=1 Tax=Bosea sp. 124 TaxID=2135642 RepID=UPI0011B1E844|nr:hypothetical protein [Bosea sp. 124]
MNATHLADAVLRGAMGVQIAEIVTPPRIPTDTLRLPQACFLIDEAWSDARSSRCTRWLWPQTDLVKAWLSEQRVGRVGAQVKATNVLEQVSKYYLGHPLPGGWIDQFDVNNILYSIRQHDTGENNVSHLHHASEVENLESGDRVKTK